MIIKFKTYLLLVLIFLLSGLLRSQNNYYTGRNNFVLELNNLDNKKLQFVEDSIVKKVESNNFSFYFYDGLVGFDVPLTKAETYFYYQQKRIQTNSYTLDMNWDNPYRQFAIYGFSKNYKTELISFSIPTTRITLDNYNNIFKPKEINLINHIIKSNIAKTVDSNYTIIHEDSLFNTHRKIDINTYDILPQASLKVLITILENHIFEGTIIAYSNDSLIKKLLKSEARDNMSIKTVYTQYDDVNKIPETTSTLIEQIVCNSIAISEKITYKTITDSLSIYNYHCIHFYDERVLSELLTANFEYKAIGLNYIHENEIKTIWIKYDNVKSIIEKSNMNFSLYEAIFTKNLFDILEIENDYLQKSDYKKQIKCHSD